MRPLFYLVGATIIFISSSSTAWAGNERGVKQQYIERNVFLCMDELSRGQIDDFKFKQSTPLKIDKCLNEYGIELNFEDIAKLPTDEELTPKQKQMFEEVQYFKLNEKGVEMLKTEIRNGTFHEAPLEFLGLEKKQAAYKMPQEAKKTIVKGNDVKGKDADKTLVKKEKKRPTFVVPQSNENESTTPKPVFIH